MITLNHLFPRPAEGASHRQAPNVGIQVRRSIGYGPI